MTVPQEVAAHVAFGGRATERDLTGRWLVEHAGVDEISFSRGSALAAPHEPAAMVIAIGGTSSQPRGF